jgi:hypothetical protein
MHSGQWAGMAAAKSPTDLLPGPRARSTGDVTCGMRSAPDLGGGLFFAPVTKRWAFRWV